MAAAEDLSRRDNRYQNALPKDQGMRKSSRIWFGASLFLFLASMGTCFLGTRYAISRIPPEELKRIGETDWIGVEWILRGGILLIVAVVLALVPLIRALFERLSGTRHHSRT